MSSGHCSRDSARVLMSRGRIVADGAKEDILQVERLKELFGVSVEMARRDGHYHLS